MQLMIECQNNAAQVLLKAERWADAEATCDELLETDPSNTKARFRRCKARINGGKSVAQGYGGAKLEAAKEDLAILLFSEPNNKQVRNTSSAP